MKGDDYMEDKICKGKVAFWIVTKVEPQKDYTLIITFITGEKKIYNALPLLEKNIYKPLKNLSFFMQAKVVGDTVDVETQAGLMQFKVLEISRSM